MSILRFSGSQQAAMNHQFQSLIENNPVDWNETSSADVLWGRCFDVLIENYRSRTGAVATEAFVFLTKRKEEGDLKAFFSQHVLTTVDQVQNRVSQFIRRLRINQDAQYTCFIPALRSSAIACFIAAENRLTRRTKENTYYTLSTDLRGRLAVVREIDLFMGDALGQVEMPRSKFLNKHRCLETDFSVHCQMIYQLPSSSVNLIKDKIEPCVRKSFQVAIDEIGRVQEVKRRAFIYMLGSIFILGAAWMWSDYFNRRFELISL